MAAGSKWAFADAYRLLCFAWALLSFGPLAYAQQGAVSPGPFASMSGSWSGSGTIGLSNGTTERLRCRAAYAVASAGTTLQQSLNCASDSYTFELRTDIDYEGGRIAGLWAETTRNLQGRISGRASAGRIDAVAEGPNFSARITLNTRGARQSVSIRSEGTELSQVSVDLTRTR